MQSLLSSLSPHQDRSRLVHVHTKFAPGDPLLQARRRRRWTLHTPVSPNASVPQSWTVSTTSEQDRFPSHGGRSVPLGGGLSVLSPGTANWPAPPWKPSCRHATTAAVCKQLTRVAALGRYPYTQAAGSPNYGVLSLYWQHIRFAVTWRRNSNKQPQAHGLHEGFREQAQFSTELLRLVCNVYSHSFATFASVQLTHCHVHLVTAVCTATCDVQILQYCFTHMRTQD